MAGECSHDGSFIVGRPDLDHRIPKALQQLLISCKGSYRATS